jgi:TIR domain
LEAQPRPKGIVFISYVRADIDRVRPLVDELAKRFNIFIDVSSLKPGTYWRAGIVEGLNRARCLLALYTKGLTDERVTLDEMDRVRDRKIILPVKLDSEAKIPFGYGGLQVCDLCDWQGGAEGLSALFARINTFLAADRAEEEGQVNTYRTLEFQINVSSDNVTQLRMFANQVATLGGVLAGDSQAVEDVKGSLKEIHATCDATLKVIDRFLKPMPPPGHDLADSYLIVPDELRKIVRDNAGHCTRILEYYERVGGLHDWLVEHTKEKPELVKQADEVFARLANADGDIFKEMTSIATTLGAEAAEIRGLLIEGREAEAQNRLRDAQLKLSKLREPLQALIDEFSNAKSALGYVYKQGNAT